MLKLLIVDDERVIRETISKIIPWDTLDIELIGLAQNGLEAYDMILDHSPDIVLTDIKMPGMNGVELIKEVVETDFSTQFIILSGYGEFEYAKEAMKYGVRHYILKPCDEQEILESLRETVSDCYKRKQEQVQKGQQSLLANIMQSNMVSDLLNKYITNQISSAEMLQTHSAFIDFSDAPYHLIYIYYLEYDNLNCFLSRLKEYYKQSMPQIPLHGAYVKNTLLLFFQDYAEDYTDLELFLSSIQLPASSVSVQLKSCDFGNLLHLLQTISPQLKRYSSMYTLNQFQPIYNCNYHSFSQEAFTLLRKRFAKTKEADTQLQVLMDGIDDPYFFKQISSSLLIEGALQYGIPSVQLAEWLTELMDIPDLAELKNFFDRSLQTLQDTYALTAPGFLSKQIRQYVQAHLSDSSMSLKEIAENHLYMNVDYVSKKFQKETGQKFSEYLAQSRIHAAKEWMAKGYKIQEVAELIGCGNNPHYFSQLFKKETGITPSAYINQYTLNHNSP